MAWSPARRANAGVDGVGQPGDYATLNSNPPRDGTGLAAALEKLVRALEGWIEAVARTGTEADGSGDPDEAARQTMAWTRI